MSTRIEREKKTITAMLRIYCADQHARPSSQGLCEACGQLQDYAHKRLDVCPFQEQKPACNRCEVHCYAATMRQRVTEVMRYSGPRMMLRYPLLSLLHLFDTWREVPSLIIKRRNREKN